MYYGLIDAVREIVAKENMTTVARLLAQILKDQGKEELFRMLDRGIDDMEEGRELPLEEVFNAVDRLVERRKRARA